MIGVQIAKALGASKVVATARTAAKKDLLAGLGADAVIVTDEQELTEAVLAWTHGRGDDVVRTITEDVRSEDA